MQVLLVVSQKMYYKYNVPNINLVIWTPSDFFEVQICIKNTSFLYLFVLFSFLESTR